MTLNSGKGCVLLFFKLLLVYGVFLVGRDVENHSRLPNSILNSTASTMTFDTRQLDGQWVKNLTKLSYRKTKLAISVLMREKDFVTMRWMVDERVKDTTIFLLSDGVDVNSLQKVDRNMYGITLQSNTTREAGACTSPVRGVVSKRP